MTDSIRVGHYMLYKSPRRYIRCDGVSLEQAYGSWRVRDGVRLLGVWSERLRPHNWREAIAFLDGWIPAVECCCSSAMALEGEMNLAMLEEQEKK